MHEPLLARAALPALTRICGIPLKPYSLGHELFLIRESSPFVFDQWADGTPRVVLPGDLLEAVWICANSFKSCKNSQNSLLYLPAMMLLNRRVRKSNVEAEIEAFRSYRAEGCLEFPLSDIVKPDAPTPRTPGAPFILRLHQFIVDRLRKTEDEAWDYPVGLAKMRWVTHWEEEKGLEVYNEDNAEMDRLTNEEAA